MVRPIAPGNVKFLGEPGSERPFRYLSGTQSRAAGVVTVTDVATSTPAMRLPCAVSASPMTNAWGALLAAAAGAASTMSRWPVRKRSVNIR